MSDFTMNIYQRLMEISHELGPVSRDLENEKVSGSLCAAVSDCAVLDAIKPLEYKYRVFSYPVERKKTSETVRREWTDSFGKPHITLLLVDYIEVRYRFVNVDNPEDYVEITSYGAGIGTDDKGVGKGMAYADKYALMNAYKLTGRTAEGPDPEVSPEDGGISPLSVPHQSVQHSTEGKQTVWSPLGSNLVIPQQARPSQTRSAERQSNPSDASVPSGDSQKSNYNEGRP